METEEEVAAADDVFFAEEMRKARAGKTTEQIRAEAEDCLRRWRAHQADNARHKAQMPIFHQWGMMQ